MGSGYPSFFAVDAGGLHDINFHQLRWYKALASLFTLWRKICHHLLLEAKSPPIKFCIKYYLRDMYVVMYQYQVRCRNSSTRQSIILPYHGPYTRAVTFVWKSCRRANAHWTPRNTVRMQIAPKPTGVVTVYSISIISLVIQESAMLPKSFCTLSSDERAFCSRMPPVESEPHKHGFNDYGNEWEWPVTQHFLSQAKCRTFPSVGILKSKTL